VTRLVPVVLCGGAGTRLWPLSRKDRPKQLLELAGGRTLLEATLRQLDGLVAAHPMLVTSAATRFQVADRLAEAGLVHGDVVVEPEPRGTAAAVAAAGLLAGGDPVLLVLPSDHHVAAPEAFRAAVRAGLPHAEAGRLVIFAVPPTRPETGFGWIALGPALGPSIGDDAGGARAVDAFVEKPDAATAAAFAADGRHAWNAGIFLFRASAWAAALDRHAPAVAAAAARGVDEAVREHGFVRLGASFAHAPVGSVDTAVLERADGLVAVPLVAGWSDVGSFAALHDAQARDDAGNAADGDVVLVDTHGSYVHAEHRLVVGLGLRDTIVVETADAVLVAPHHRAQDVRDVVERLRAAGRAEADLHADAERPWGAWTTVDAGPAHRVKRLVVRPGGRLSLQVHARRAEHWVVVEGRPRVTIGTDVRELGPGDVVTIPVGVAHRVENPGSGRVVIVEVAVGDVDEDDVKRLEDRYGR
jgi:mannose-1-phosphate guanylyltransferase/mannose-6-phosphate isomerase